MPPRTRRTTKPVVVAEIDDEPTPTPRRRRTATNRVKPAEQPVEVDEEPAPKPRRRKLATVEAPPVEADTDDEPVAKPRRRRLASVKPAAEPEPVDADDEPPVAKPRRRTAAAPAKRAMTKPVADVEVDDDGLTPNQRKMAALRAKRKPRDPNAPVKPAAPKKPPIEFGTKWLSELVTAEFEKPVDTFSLRAVLRRLAASGVLKRQVGVERGRYEFTGPDDPTVKAVLEAYGSGQVDKDKRDKLAGLKKGAAAKKSTAKQPAARGRKPKPPPVDEEVEYDEDDVDEL
jgi:hypothetical protein